MTTAILIKENHLIGAGLNFIDLIYYCHGRKHGSTQADMVCRGTSEFYIWIGRTQEVRVILALV